MQSFRLKTKHLYSPISLNNITMFVISLLVSTASRQPCTCTSVYFVYFYALFIIITFIQRTFTHTLRNCVSGLYICILTYSSGKKQAITTNSAVGSNQHNKCITFTCSQVQVTRYCGLDQKKLWASYSSRGCADTLRFVPPSHLALPMELIVTVTAVSLMVGRDTHTYHSAFLQLKSNI